MQSARWRAAEPRPLETALEQRRRARLKDVRSGVYPSSTAMARRANSDSISPSLHPILCALASSPMLAPSIATFVSSGSPFGSLFANEKEGGCKLVGELDAV